MKECPSGMGACCISVSKPNVYAGGLLLVLVSKDGNIKEEYKRSQDR